MTLQFRRNAIKDGEVTQDHHDYFAAHTARVAFSALKDDNPTAPPGVPGEGDTYWVRGSGACTGAWSSFTLNNVIQYTSYDGWTLLDSNGPDNGDVIRVHALPANTASFSGWANQLAEWSVGDAAFVHNIECRDGFQVIESGTGTSADSYWYNNTVLFDEANGDWEIVAGSLSIGSSDNALLFINDELYHREQLGHEWTNPNGYFPGIVFGPVAAMAANVAALYPSYSFIATTGASYPNPSGGTYNASAGEYLYQEFGTWVKVGDRADGDTLAIPSAGATGSWAQRFGHTSNIAIWDAAAATYSFIAPHAGDRFAGGDPEVGSHVWRGTDVFFDGTAWQIQSQDPSELTKGDTVELDGFRNLEVVALVNGGIAKTSSGIIVWPVASGGTVDANNPVADKDYVLAQLEGLHWQAPAQVLKLRDDTHSAGPTAPYPGLAMVAASGVTSNWLAAGFTENDVLEWSGATWVKITSLTALTTGLRFVCAPTGVTGSIAGYDDNIATWEGSAFSFTGPQDGWALILVGEGGYYENQQYVYDSVPGDWVQMGAQQVYSASGGLYENNNKFGLDFVMDERTPTLAATGVSFTGLSIVGSALVDAYVSMYRNGQKLLRNDAGPTVGEFKWDNANSHAIVAASDAFQAGEVMEIMAFGKP